MNKNWNKTRVSDVLGIKYPILQGPMGGGLSSSRLVSAVSNFGGLGGYGAYKLQPEEIRVLDSEIKSFTSKPYNINLWVNDVDEISSIGEIKYQKVVNLFKPFFEELNVPIPEQPKKVQSKFEKQVETILQLRPPAFSFVFGIPSKEILLECKRQGIVTIGTATTLDEGLALEAAGVDLIVASGFEAGGHRPSFIKSSTDSFVGTFVLVQQIANRVKTPVIAAGGIANADGILAAFNLGASGVQMGTAFLASEESGASKEYRNLLFSKMAKNTMVTAAFTGRMGRGISNVISNATKYTMALPFPLQTHFMEPLLKAAIAQGKHEMVFFWAGQIATNIKSGSAKEILETMISDIDNRQLF